MNNHTSLRVLDANTASIFGSDAAILLNRIEHWLNLGYGLEHQGERWIYNTYQQIAERELPWLSPSQIKRLIWMLRDDGVLLVKRLRSHLYNQTNHYRINYERLNELISNSPVSSNGRNRSFQETQATDDLYTEKTFIENGSEIETDSIEKPNEKTNQQSVEAIETGKTQTTQETQTEPLTETDRKESNLPAFHRYLVDELINYPNIKDPLAYAQKIIDNLRQGSASSQKLYEQWLRSIPTMPSF